MNVPGRGDGLSWIKQREPIGSIWGRGRLAGERGLSVTFSPHPAVKWKDGARSDLDGSDITWFCAGGINGLTTRLIARLSYVSLGLGTRFPGLAKLLGASRISFL